MAEKSQREAVEEVGKKTGRDPVILAAVASVGLAWVQFYLRGNREHALFIGLWPPTLLAFSNALRINDISRKVEDSTKTLFERLTE